ncbi:MAG: ACT domain-containing protein [Bacillota bacterium]|nr:MAG: ACT domain-containing protein [Bacillota bacterium]
MEIKKITADFSVCKVSDYSLTDLSREYCFIAKTDEENSLVCPTEQVPPNAVARSDGWKAFRIQGILDFSLIGVISKISALLAAENIGIFVLSTYNTDYVFVKRENLNRALSALENAGYKII